MKERGGIALLCASLFAFGAAADGGPWGNRRGFNPHDSWHGPSTGTHPTFDFNPGLAGSGPSLDSSTLTMNGTTMTLLADYDARDISGATWPARGGVAGTLTEVSAGGSPTAGAPVPFIESSARGVTYGGTNNKYHDGLPTGIGTSDYALEFVARFVDQGGTHEIVDDSDSNLGIAFEYLAGGNARVIHGDGTAVNATFGVATGSWEHVICFAKRTTTLRCYLDATNVTNLDISARTGSITSTNGLEVGGATWIGATASGSETVALVRAWKCSACLNTTGEMDTTAAQRFARIVGTPPTSLSARATLGYEDIDRDGDGNRRLFLVGNGWPRLVKRKDSGSVYRVGYLDEGAAANLALQSQAFDNASWTATNCNSSANSLAAPDGTTTADSCSSTAGAGNVEHFFRQPIVLTAATHALSVWYNTGPGRHVWIRDATIANGVAWFSPTCTTGTKQAGIATSLAENFGNGWCRASLTLTGTAASHNIDIGYSNFDNITSYDAGAGGSTDIRVWGGQVEASGFATSYIATTTATVARNSDELRPDASVVSTTNGTFEVQFLCPASAVIGNPRFMTVADATGAAPAVYIDPSGTNEARCEYFSGGVSQATIFNATANYADNAVHKIRATFTTNDARCFFDDAQIGTTDTSVIVASGATKFAIGSNANGAIGSGGGQIGCVITRSRTWSVILVNPVALP